MVINNLFVTRGSNISCVPFKTVLLVSSSSRDVAPGAGPLTCAENTTLHVACFASHSYRPPLASQGPLEAGASETGTTQNSAPGHLTAGRNVLASVP